MGLEVVLVVINMKNKNKNGIKNKTKVVLE